MPQISAKKIPCPSENASVISASCKIYGVMEGYNQIDSLAINSEFKVIRKLSG